MLIEELLNRLKEGATGIRPWPGAYYSGASQRVCAFIKDAQYRVEHLDKNMMLYRDMNREIIGFDLYIKNIPGAELVYYSLEGHKSIDLLTLIILSYTSDTSSEDRDNVYEELIRKFRFMQVIIEPENGHASDSLLDEALAVK